MDVNVYDFPTMSDGVTVVEHKYCELLNKYRDGAKLPPEALDWMDTANTWLMTSESSR